jgi:tetratricopeptide (TPR) repeat protein
MSAQPPTPKPAPLQRLRQWLARLRGGDVIVANVGQGASDVVIGKNILKIGTLVVPALPAVIALIAALLSGTGGLWLYLVPATMPPGNFNIAVAEFATVDGQGRQRVTSDSRLISRTLFTTIQGELGQLPADYPAMVWHDSMSFLQKRTAIGAIAGASPAERSGVACRRAEELNADIIVYGVLDERTTPAQLQLQFCTRNTTRDRDMGNLAELQKVDRLGSPLPVELPLTDVQSSVNPPLRVRTALLARLVVGLRYELASNPNLQSNLRRALDTFSKALSYLQQEDGAATGANGGDLVDYFVGREHFLLFQDPATPQTERAGHLEAARDAFQQATQLNPNYARAYSALGAVYFHRAQQTAPAARLASDDLAAALDTYRTAIALARASGDAPAEAEAHLAQALIYRLQAEAFAAQSPPDAAAAEDALSHAEAEAGAGEALTRPEQNRLRGFAAMARGLIAHQRAQIRLRAGDKAAARELFTQASQLYGQCIAAGQADPGDQFLRRQIIEPTCAPYQASTAAAAQRIQ